MNVKVINKSVHGLGLPKYETSGASAMDIRSNERIIIQPYTVEKVGTGLFVEVPHLIDMSFRSRSGLSIKGLIVRNAPATIDSDFRNEVKVILYNESDSPIIVDLGERVAQCIFTPIVRINWQEVKELSKTDRKGGFGSTGLK